MAGWKDTGIANAGTSIKYGADDLEMLMRGLNGITSGINSVEWKSTNKWGFWDNVLYIRNQADTQNTTIRGAATMTTSFTLTLPSQTANDTLPAVGLANTWTAQQALNLGFQLQDQTAPSTPSSGFGKFYYESGHFKKKSSTGAVTDYDNISVGIPSNYPDASINILNPAGTFQYTIRTSAIVANRNITLPLLTANDTFAFLGIAQVFTDKQTISRSSSADVFEVRKPTNTLSDTVNISFQLNDSASNTVNYARIQAKINDPNNGSEDGYLEFLTRQTDVLTRCLQLTDTGALIIGNNARFKIAETGLTAERTYTGPDVTTQLAGLASANTFTADQVFNETVNLNADFTIQADISPSQITSDQNDYNPTGLSTAVVIRLDADASFRTITGLAGGYDGRIIILQNVNHNTILLADSDTASSASNRFDFGGTNDIIDFPLFAHCSIALRYDGTNSRWLPLDRSSALLIPDINQGYYLYDDFLDLNSPSIWFFQTAPSGGSFTNINALANHQGVTQVTLGTSSTGSAGCRTGTIQYQLGNSWYFRYDFIGKVDALSDGTNTYTLRIGFIDSGTAESTDGVFLRYTHSVNSGNWVFVARSASTESTSNTSSAVQTTNYFRATIIINPAGNRARAYINGVQVGSDITTNIPAGGGRTGAGWMFLKSAGTANNNVFSQDAHRVVGYGNTLRNA